MRKGTIVFVAWRELRFARGRFLLIGAVVALITLLVGFFSGLTGGLAAQNISSVLQQPSDGSPGFSSSSIDDEAVRVWQQADGIESVIPIGIVQSSASAGDAADPAGVALYGIPLGMSGASSPLFALAPTGDDKIGLSSGAAGELGVGIGAGLLAVIGLGAVVAQALPFVVSPLTTLVPAAVLAVLGLLGAAFALRSVTKADPLTALGSNR